MNKYVYIIQGTTILDPKNAEVEIVGDTCYLDIETARRRMKEEFLDKIVILKRECDMADCKEEIYADLARFFADGRKTLVMKIVELKVFAEFPEII